MSNEFINDPAKQKIDWSKVKADQNNLISAKDIDKAGLLEWAIDTINNAASDIIRFNSDTSNFIRCREDRLRALSCAVYIKGVTEVVKEEIFGESESEHDSDNTTTKQLNSCSAKVIM